MKKIAIVVYSRSGNTLSVAKRLKDKFAQLGHDGTILQVKASNDRQRKSNLIHLIDNPDVSAYDTIIFASPVHAGTLSPVMQMYLNQLPSLENKTISGFVTQAFPYPFLGGNQAMTCFKALLQLKSIAPTKTCIIPWYSSSKREKAIEASIKTLVSVV